MLLMPRIGPLWRAVSLASSACLLHPLRASWHFRFSYTEGRAPLCASMIYIMSVSIEICVSRLRECPACHRKPVFRYQAD